MPKTENNAPAGAVLWRCKVTAVGATKKFGRSKHKKGKGAVVTLTEAEAEAAAKEGWVTKEGLVEAPSAAEEATPAKA